MSLDHFNVSKMVFLWSRSIFASASVRHIAPEDTKPQELQCRSSRLELESRQPVVGAIEIIWSEGRIVDP